MSHNNPWDPFGRNNPLTGGNPERNWLTRAHRDATQPDQENTRRPVQNFLKLQARDNRLERLAQTAGKFVQKAYEMSTLSQIPLGDYMMFHGWLYPDGKKLDLNRATYLAAQEQQYYRQYYPQRIEEAEIHFLKSFLKELSQIGDGDEHKHKHKKKANNNEEALEEAYEAGKQEGEEEGYYRNAYYRNAYYRNKRYRDSYYRREEKLENDPNNDPLG